VRPALLFRLAALVVLAAAASSLTYAILTLGVRPLDGVEGEVLFEGARIRSGLPLYTDPVAGATEYGPIASRFYVLYPPVWAWLVSWVPPRSVVLVARTVASFAWFGLLVAIALRAPRERRAMAWVAAAFTAGVYTLTLYGAAARPDALAVALAGAALVRAVERGKVDMRAGALFAFAAWTKPNVIGLAAGAFAVQLLLDRKTTARAVASALFVSGGIAAILQHASGGTWTEHVLRATGQPVSFALWAEQVPSRLQFLGAPIAAALVVAWRARASGPGPKLALGALAGSFAWTLVSLAKIGSATNYWMEPMVAVAVIAALVPFALPETGRLAWGLAAASLLQAFWTGVATMRSVPEAIEAAKVHASFVERVRKTCSPGVDEVILADEPGLELMLNGRVVTTPFQMTHLARRGKYPLEPWVADVLRVEARCLLMEDDLLDRPLGDVSVEHDRFGPELRAVLRAKFVRSEEQGGWRLYRASR
jgi:hypothetical protein